MTFYINKNCAIDKRLFFPVNIRAFSEAQNYNLYFNRNLFIGRNGELKNSKETVKIYGNIFKLTFAQLKSIIESEEFQYLGKISKDQIEGCNKCSYRYICVDNRVPISNGSLFKFDTKCDYLS